MRRHTITLHPTVEEVLRKIQAAMIEKFLDDFSFTTVVNMVLVGGLVGSDKFTDEEWDAINEFLQDERGSLEIAGDWDRIVEHIRKNRELG